ncbi:MAG: zinc ribbon domain-containing protein [Phycisphaerales bacterium]|nr:zinc ribbon domain-containing protein [Phycisphaerales bacterium]
MTRQPAILKECPACGTQVPDDANFCSCCRHDLAPPESNDATSGRAIVAFVVIVGGLLITAIILSRV